MLSFDVFDDSSWSAGPIAPATIVGGSAIALLWLL